MIKQSLAATLALSVCLLWLGQAHAQGYTYKEIKPPSDAHGCFNSGRHHMLSDNGDVALSCQYFSRIDWTIFQSEYNLNRISVWRSTGAAQRLNPPVGYSSNLIGMDRRGNVLDVIRKLSSTAAPQSAWWRGTTRSTVATPQGFTGAWEALATNPSGQVLVLKRGTTSSARGSLAIFNGGSGQALPLPPGGQGDLSFMSGAVALLNDVGQVVLNGYGEYGTLWFWNGSQWSSIPKPDQELYELQLLFTDLNVRGEVLLLSRTDGKAYVWRESTGHQLLPLSAPQNFYFLALLDNGDVLGSGQSGPDLARNAVLLRNGQALDLNQLVALPAGVILQGSEDGNAKGQILASSAGSAGKLRYWLLTPR